MVLLSKGIVGPFIASLGLIIKIADSSLALSVTFKAKEIHLHHLIWKTLACGAFISFLLTVVCLGSGIFYENNSSLFSTSSYSIFIFGEQL